MRRFITYTLLAIIIGAFPVAAQVTPIVPIYQPGPNWVIGLPTAANTTAMGNLSTVFSPYVIRAANSTNGDVESTLYYGQTAACSIVGGDGLTQIPSANGGCWIRTPDSLVSPTITGTPTLSAQGLTQQALVGGNGGNTSYGAEQTTLSLLGNENAFFGDRAGAVLGSSSCQFDTAVGHDALGIGTLGTGGYTGANCSSITAVGTDALRNYSGGSLITAIGTSALKSQAQATANGLTAVGAQSMVNESNANGGNNSTAIGLNSCAGASGTASFRQALCLGDTTGGALTTANNFLIAGHGVGNATFASGVGVILIGSGAVTVDTAAAGTSNYLSIENIYTATATGTNTTSVPLIHGTLQLPDIANAAGNEILCFTSSTGLVTWEPSVATCVPSALQFKNPEGVIDGAAGLAALSAFISPAVYTYKDTQAFGSAPRDGLIADEMCQLDELLCIRDTDGSIKNYDHNGALAYAYAMIKVQQRQIDGLRRYLGMGR